MQRRCLTFLGVSRPPSFGRVLEARRSACKNSDVQENLKSNLRTYVEKEGAEVWYWDLGKHGDGTPTRFLESKPHPTKGRKDDLIEQVQANGPIGYLIASVIRMGMIVDSEFKIWQRNEPPIDVLHVPYHWITPLGTEAANRARARADWGIRYTKVALREIDIGVTKGRSP